MTAQHPPDWSTRPGLDRAYPDVPDHIAVTLNAGQIRRMLAEAYDTGQSLCGAGPQGEGDPPKDGTPFLAAPKDDCLVGLGSFINNFYEVGGGFLPDVLGVWDNRPWWPINLEAMVKP